MTTDSPQVRSACLGETEEGKGYVCVVVSKRCVCAYDNVCVCTTVCVCVSECEERRARERKQED